MATIKREQSPDLTRAFIKREASPERPLAAISPLVNRQPVQNGRVTRAVTGKMVTARFVSKTSFTVEQQTRVIRNHVGAAATQVVNNAISRHFVAPPSAQQPLPHLQQLTHSIYSNRAAQAMDLSDWALGFDGIAVAPVQQNTDDSVVVPRTEFESLQAQVEQQGRVIEELVTFNNATHVTVDFLESRVTCIELQQLATMDRQNHNNNTAPQQLVHDTADRHRSASPDVRDDQDYRVRDLDTRRAERAQADTPSGKRRYQDSARGLRIQIPERPASHSQAVPSLPTPLTMNASSSAALEAMITPSTPEAQNEDISTPVPITPGRNCPPSGSRSLYKRNHHNLDKTLPAASARLPKISLTDTELVVFFFNSLNRPHVSLRLYANGWGPKEICGVLNSHRDIDPPYLRNTVSVKCTAAIKKGRDKWGDNWETATRRAFNSATVAKATDMLHEGDHDATQDVDYDVRDLSRGLKHYPENGTAGGIFTRCVRFCKANNLQFKLSDVWQLASAIESGRIDDSAVIAAGDKDLQSSLYAKLNHGVHGGQNFNRSSAYNDPSDSCQIPSLGGAGATTSHSPRLKQEAKDDSPREGIVATTPRRVYVKLEPQND